MIIQTNILGVGVNALTITLALDKFQSWIENDELRYVCITGVHGVMESQRSSKLKSIHNHAGMVTPDGMPLVWLCRLHGHKETQRVYGPDLLLAACERSLTTGWKHYFYGGAPGVAERLIARLEERFPGLPVAGCDTPPFRPLTPQEDQVAVERINQSGADIVWVGLSTPKQEFWMAEHLGKVKAPVMIGVGAAFDFHAGLKKQAPYWMQRSGLEWFFRLATEPRRLWKR
jgi:N-acetylglucosaminyldiphosphoundecaprenol N-acetyl-beta-D-mannosaminyltransferase